MVRCSEIKSTDKTGGSESEGTGRRLHIIVNKDDSERRIIARLLNGIELSCCDAFDIIILKYSVIFVFCCG